MIKGYLEAITTSVKLAGHGIAFAADGVSLFERPNQHPGTDVCLFIDEMQKIARLVHENAQDTYEKFSAVRRTLVQVCIRSRSLGVTD